MSRVAPNVTNFFERFPAAKEAYASASLYHLTHSRYLAGIQANGLQTNVEPFPQEHGAFLLDVYDRYGPNHPSDRHYIQDRILGSSAIFLSAVQPNMEGRLDYGVPERLLVLMRSMAALATKENLTDGERNFAAAALEEHRQALSAGDPAIVALEVNPLAPEIVNHRLGHPELDEIRDPEIAVETMRYVDGNYSSNIGVAGAIEPEFISEFGRTPFDPATTLSSINTVPSWVASIR